MQKTVKKTRSRKEQVTEDQQETTEVSSTNEVSEEATCCLLAIDEVLEENDNRELTDEEIYAQGRPDWVDISDLDEMWRNGEITDAEWDRLTDERYDEYRAKMDRYAQAYENITGSKFDRCTC